MKRQKTWFGRMCSAVCVVVTTLGTLSVSEAAEPADLTPVVTAGAWTIESGQNAGWDAIDGRVVALEDARFRGPGEHGWVWAADNVRLHYDVLGRVDSIAARGRVRVVGRTGAASTAPITYTMGDVAWFDASGVHGTVAGSDVALVREDWRMRATHVDFDFGASSLAARGVKSGVDRAQRDDN